MIFFSILIFVFILGLIIFIHEFCHFLAAKRTHAKVEEFCIGYPPRIYTKKKGETKYSIGLIPWGGFVKILGEDPTEERKEGSFYSLSFWQRFWIILAGVFSNFIFAIFLFSLAFYLGYPQPIETEKESERIRDIRVQIIYVEKDSPAEKAGILPGDRILKIVSSEKVIFPKEVKEVQEFVRENIGKEILIGVERGSKKLTLKVVPRKPKSKNEGPTGVMLVKTGIIKYSLPEAFFLGVKASFQYTKITFWAFGRIVKDAIFRTKTPGLELTGPIGAGSFFSKIANLGWVYIIYFTALLSLSLAIFNALPLPPLDGGRLFFLIIDKIKRSPVSPKIEKMVNEVGVVFLIILAVVVAIKDILKII